MNLDYSSIIRSFSRLWFIFVLITTPLVGSSSLAQASRVLFTSDGSTTAAFPCHYLGWAPDPTVNTTGGLPAPSIQFNTYSPASYNISAPYSPGPLTSNMKLRGTLDVKIDGSTNFVALAWFGISTRNPCDYHPYIGPYDGRYPLPQIDYASSQEILSISYTDQTGQVVWVPKNYAIALGQWHHVEFTFTPASDGYYDWNFVLDSQLIAEGRSYEPLRSDETLGVVIGATGSYSATNVSYDNIKVELIGGINADFSWSPANPTVGQQIAFTEASTGSPTSWSWDFGDGVTSTEQNPLHTYSNPGSYSAKLVGSNEVGSNEISKTIVVSGSPTISFAGFDWQIYQMDRYGTTRYLSSEDVGQNETEVSMLTSDQYSFRGIKTVDSLSEAKVTATIEMWQTGGFNWQSYPFSIMLPFATFNYYNYGSQWGLDEVSADGEWYQTGNRHFFPISPAQLGVHYIVKLDYNPLDHSLVAYFNEAGSPLQEVFRGTTHWGLIDTGRDEDGRVSKIFLETQDSTGTVHYKLSWANTSAAPTANFIWSPVIPAIKQSLNFQDTSSSSPASWLWDFGDGATSTEQNPTYAYPTPGTYEVTLTASNDAGSSSVTKQVRVNAPPVAVDGSLTTTAYHSAIGNLQASDPDNQTLTFAIANPTSRGTVTLVNATTGEFSYHPNPGVTGTDYFTFTASDGALVSTPATITITINPGNPDVIARLVDSTGVGLAGGSVSYYQAGWKAFGITGADGSVTKELTTASYPFRIEYAGGSVQLSQNIGTNPVVIFQTRNVVVQLKDSAGNPLDQGAVEYYANGWKTLGATSGGEVHKQLLPASYPVALTYLGGRVQLAQDIGANPIVIFQTRDVVVQLKDSTGNPLDQGTVEYYANGWKPFGTTSGGEVHKQLLPANYPVALTYLGGRVQLAQDIGANPVVIFQTRNVVVQLKDSAGNPLDQGTVEYYANGWKSFGTTASGEVHKQLLPANYPFAMNYAGARVQKNQDITTNAPVVFQTGAVISDSNTCTGYYASGWKAFVQDMQLLPGSYPFRFSSDAPTQEQLTVVSGMETHIR